MKFRFLRNDEYVRRGDYARSNSHASQKNADDPYLDETERSVRAERHHEKNKAGEWASGDKPQRFWRRAVEHEWISVKDRTPTAGDGIQIPWIRDPHIIVRKENRGIETRAYNNLMDATHWMPLTFIEEPPYIKVDGRELIPLQNGDIKLSCGTVIPSSDVEELFKQRKQIMEAK